MTYQVTPVTLWGILDSFLTRIFPSMCILNCFLHPYLIHIGPFEDVVIFSIPVVVSIHSEMRLITLGLKFQICIRRSLKQVAAKNKYIHVVRCSVCFCQRLMWSRLGLLATPLKLCTLQTKECRRSRCCWFIKTTRKWLMVSELYLFWLIT